MVTIRSQRELKVSNSTGCGWTSSGGDKSALLAIPDAYDFAGQRKIPAILVEGDGANRPAMSDASDTIPSGVLENLDFAGFPADCEPLPVRAPGRARRSGRITRDVGWPHPS